MSNKRRPRNSHLALVGTDKQTVTVGITRNLTFEGATIFGYVTDPEELATLDPRDVIEIKPKEASDLKQITTLFWQFQAWIGGIVGYDNGE